MWALTVSVPDYCLYFYLFKLSYKNTARFFLRLVFSSKKKQMRWVNEIIRERCIFRT